MVIQQLIQSQLFHLISMLVCIGVVAWLFVRHFFQSEQEKEKDRVRLLNTLYISGILTFLIIELVTAICMGNTKHADILSFVSFAATLSSLILSVVAIIFTIMNGNRGELQYEKLSKVSDDVTSSLKDFTVKTEAIDNSVDRFQSVAGDLMTSIHEIYEKIAGLEQPIYQMREMLLPENALKELKKTKEGGEKDLSYSYESFIERGSFSGNLTLFACSLSKAKEQPFKMNEIRENEDDEAYSFGYIIAAWAMGVISIRVSAERNVEVLNCIPGLREMTEKALLDFADNPSHTASKEKYLNRINSIKSLFGSN